MVMRIITLEDHFATPMFQKMFRRGNVFEHYLAERGDYLGYNISAELMNLGDTRVAAMDATGIDVQVLSLTMPACEGFEIEAAVAMAWSTAPDAARSLGYDVPINQWGGRKYHAGCHTQ